MYKHRRKIIPIQHTIFKVGSKLNNKLQWMKNDRFGMFIHWGLYAIPARGEWMKYNSESIYGCTKSEFPKPEWGRFTQNGKNLYVHITDKTTGSLVIPNIGDKVEKARFLCDGVEINIDEPWNGKYAQGKNNLFLNISAFDLPDESDTVLKLTLK